MNFVFESWWECSIQVTWSQSLTRWWPPTSWCPPPRPPGPAAGPSSCQPGSSASPWQPPPWSWPPWGQGERGWARCRSCLSRGIDQSQCGNKITWSASTNLRPEVERIKCGQMRSWGKVKAASFLQPRMEMITKEHMLPKAGLDYIIQEQPIKKASTFKREYLARFIDSPCIEF